MIESILATDMSFHAKNLSNLKTKIETFNINNGKNIEKMISEDNVSKTYENQQLVLSMIIHSADISNPAKPAHVYKSWVNLLFIELFKQGDEELSLNLPITPLCDRNTTNINKSQLGFINFIVLPTFESLNKIIPEISRYIEMIKENYKRYEKLVKEESC